MNSSYFYDVSSYILFFVSITFSFCNSIIFTGFDCTSIRQHSGIISGNHLILGEGSTYFAEKICITDFFYSGD